MEDRTREVRRSLAVARGLTTTFKLNPGNHFTDEAGRTARGIAWVLELFPHHTTGRTCKP